MAKRSKAYVKWLDEDERGWVGKGHPKRKTNRWGDVSFWHTARKQWLPARAWKPRDLDRHPELTRVYPRPAKPQPKPRTVKAWAVVGPDGSVAWFEESLSSAKRLAKLANEGDSIVKLTGTYTPKARS